MNQVILEKIADYSRQHGYRQTTKRTAVALALNQFNTYTDADALWIFLRKKDPRISKGTVYLALQWLTAAGLVDRKVREDRVYSFFLRRS